MDFAQFKNQFQNRPFILSRDALSFVKNPQVLRNQFNRWQKKGLLISLRKGVYILNEQDRKIPANVNALANILYEPSYLSLEYALNFYGIIPEAVADITSVSTRKTKQFKNALGSFMYQHINPEAFRGFKRVGEGSSAFFMADPEKAVVDFLYLNLSEFGDDAQEKLEQSYRFQNVEELNPEKLSAFGQHFQSRKLTRVIKILARWIKEERA